MSGGHYDYAFIKVSEFAGSLEDADIIPERERFKELLILVSTAMHDIEWVDSGDYSDGEEIESIEKIFSFLNKD